MSIKGIISSSGAGQGAFIVALFSIITKLTGLFRERVLAATFGAGDYLDAYDAAFRFPDLVFNTLVIGALGAAFIPLFLDCWEKERVSALKFATATLHIITVLSLIIALVIAVSAKFFVPWLVPGFSPEKQNLVVSLTQIMSISIVFFGISNVLASLLNAFRRFVAFSLAPALYNIGIIFGLLVLVPRYGVSGAAWGVVLGSFLHLAVNIPALRRTPYIYQRIVSWGDRLVLKLFILMLPRMFGLLVWQINLIAITVVASHLAPGSLAVFQRAFNIQSVPLSVFGVSMAVAVFPIFSQHAVSGNRNEFVATFSLATRRILVLVIPFSFLMLLLRAQITRVILGTGAYDWPATIATFSVLTVFAFSFFAQALVPLFARSFYAFQNTRTPVIISSVVVVLNIIFSIWWARGWGVVGLAAAFSLSSIINAVLLFAVFRLQIGFLDEKRILVTIFKSCLAALAMVPFVQLTKILVGQAVDMRTFAGIFFQGAAAGLVGCFAYLVVAKILKINELTVVWRSIADKIRISK